MVTAVSGFIEQVGMIKEFQNTIITINPLIIPSSFKELAQTLAIKPTCINQNWTIASRWMHMNWYMLASRQVSRLALKLDRL